MPFDIDLFYALLQRQSYYLDSYPPAFTTEHAALAYARENNMYGAKAVQMFVL